MTDLNGAGIREVALAPLTVVAVADARCSADGMEITDVGGLLADQGVEMDPELVANLPDIERGGVQGAEHGVIQDPAGSAIVSGSFAGAGGASGQIYRTFPDLAPIDRVAVGAAVFNRSTGTGRRVLHTHSPQPVGDPASAADRGACVQMLANAYVNALVAFARRAPALGGDGARLNLVPLSAGIFAGRFRHHKATWGGDSHLDPSYTVAAIVLALAWAAGEGLAPPPKTALYYFPPGPCADAVALVEALRAAR